MGLESLYRSLIYKRLA